MRQFSSLLNELHKHEDDGRSGKDDPYYRAYWDHHNKTIHIASQHPDEFGVIELVQQTREMARRTKRSTSIIFGPDHHGVSHPHMRSIIDRANSVDREESHWGHHQLDLAMGTAYHYNGDPNDKSEMPNTNGWKLVRTNF